METTRSARRLSDGRWKGRAPRPAPRGARVLTRLQVAELAGVSRRTVTRWLSEGLLERYACRPPGVNVRTTVVLLESDVRSFLGLPEDDGPQGP